MPTVYGLNALNSTEPALAQAARDQAVDILARTPPPARSIRPFPVYNASIGVPPTITYRQESSADGLYQTLPRSDPHSFAELCREKKGLS
jgi:hypothetical protein